MFKQISFLVFLLISKLLKSSFLIQMFFVLRLTSTFGSRHSHRGIPKWRKLCSGGDDKGVKRLLGHNPAAAPSMRRVNIADIFRRQPAPPSPRQSRKRTPAKASSYPSIPHDMAEVSSSSRAPPLNYTTRGSLPDEPLDNEQRAALLEDLAHDVIRSGTAAGRESCIKTWTTLHHRWWGTSVPVLPITPCKLRAIAAQMKQRGYRSFPNFVVAVKELHCEAGGTWTDEIDLCRRKCVASTQRGIGPARQCMEVPILRVSVLELGNDPLSADGPICPQHWAVLCTFHLLRGAESASALASALVIDSTLATESLKLPASKTDPSAWGCTRTWGCVCTDRLSGQPYDGKPPCPYHAAISHKVELVRRFGRSDGSLPEDLPLFPNCSGAWCSRSGFVESIETMAVALCLPTVDDMGRSTLGEHVWRVTGARHLARLLVPYGIITLLARWGSNVILRYIAEAPLENLTNVYREAMGSSHSPPVAPLSLPAIALAAFEPEAFDADALDDPPPAEAGLLHKFALSNTNFVHIIARRMAWERARPGRTMCGWDYRAQQGSLHHTIPRTAFRCAKCAKPAAWQLRVDASDSD